MSLEYQQISTDLPCKGVTVGAETNVDLYQNRFAIMADDAIKELSLQINDLQNLDWNPEGFGANAGEVLTFGLNYTPPSDIPSWDFILDMPIYNIQDPTLNNIDPTIVATKPDAFTDKPEAIITPIKPEALDVKFPDQAPIISEIIIPDVPVIGNIPDPIIKGIQVPSLAPLDYPDFNGNAPSSAALIPIDDDFTWNEAAYDSAILQATQGRISEFLAGGVGIPDYVWDAIWQRGRDKETRTSIKMVTEITEESSERGFDIPQGPQMGRIDEAIKKSQDVVNTLNRELIIQQAQHEIENLKYAIAQGQALEGMIGGWYENRMGRALDAAKFSVQSSIEVFNAHLGLYTAQVQLYAIEAQVYKAILEAEMFKLEEFKARLDAARLTGELNLQEIEIYKARISAFSEEVNAFESQVNAQATIVQSDGVRMDGYKTEVSAAAELVRAKAVEYDGYKAQWEGEIAKVTLFESQVRSYSEQMKGYQIEVEAESTEKDILLKINDEQFKKFSSNLEGHNARVQTELSNLDAASKEFDANSNSYNLLVANEQNILKALVDDHQLAISHAAQVTQAAIATASNLTNASTAENEKLKTSAEVMARAYSQLAASAMSAVHVSANISDSTNNSSTCGSTFSTTA